MENSKTEKKTIFSIITNRVDDYDQWYKEYVEWCKENEIEPADDNSSDYWEWVGEQIELNIECDLENMEYSKIKDRTFVITGAVQLWNGRRTIKPKFVHGLIPLIKLLWGSDDRHFDITLDTEEGIITSRLWSHDDPMGNTRLEARMLNKNGEKWLAAAEDRGEEDEIEIKRQWWSKITDIGMIY